MTLRPFSRVCIDIGRLNYEKGNLTRRASTSMPACAGAERAMITYDILNGYSALFNLACSDHDLDRAEQIISSTEFLAKNSGFARNIVDRAEAMKARLSMAKADAHGVRYWLQAQQQPLQFPFFQGYQARTAVRALMMLKEFDQASNLLHDLLSAAEVRQSLREIVHYRTWLARLLYQQGNLPAALRVLQKAVRISANQGFVRSILDVGDPVIDLLETLQRENPPEWEGSMIPAYLSELIKARSSQPETPSPGWLLTFDTVSDPLTEREMGILRLLSKGRSNQEMAEAMIISESTVKFHLRNIYLKLGVHTRTGDRAGQGAAPDLSATTSGAAPILFHPDYPILLSVRTGGFFSLTCTMIVEPGEIPGFSWFSPIRPARPAIEVTHASNPDKPNAIHRERQGTRRHLRRTGVHLQPAAGCLPGPELEGRRAGFLCLPAPGK